jgi:hypothetical protein
VEIESEYSRKMSGRECRRRTEHLMDYKYEDIAKMIDHALLTPSLTDQDLEYGCRVALEYN